MNHAEKVLRVDAELRVVDRVALDALLALRKRKSAICQLSSTLHAQLLSVHKG